jgi:hypothetical protein
VSVKDSAFVILGNPENRRVTHFQEALVKQNLPMAHVVPWEAFLTNPTVLSNLPDDPTALRIDACGENERVETLLLERGFPLLDPNCPNRTAINPTQLKTLTSARGRLLCPRQSHLGFVNALDEITSIVAQKPHWRFTSSVNSILTCFDKRKTSSLFSSLNIPVPKQMEQVHNFDSLLGQMEAHKWTQVFVESTNDGYFNTLKVRAVTKRQDIQTIINFTLNEGAVVERATPKARLDGAYFDLRVLCINHEPTFFIVRQNTHPITNLHLGGRRGDLDSLKAQVSHENWNNMLHSCRLASKAIGALQVGLDVLFEPGFETHQLIEANAFGDLLPRLTVNGLDVWETQIKSIHSFFK